MRNLLSLIFAALAVGACVGLGASAPPPIAGFEWMAVELDGRPAAGATFRLQQGRPVAGGATGCNIWSGEYRLADGRIALSDITTTRRACAEPLMRQEAAFLQLLGEVDRYSIGPDSTLTLAAPSGRTILLRRLEGP